MAVTGGSGRLCVSGGVRETLEDPPPHVWKALPENMRLGPSAVNQHRIGVWAVQAIPRGKRFGPFVGERKKRSQVTSNVYMWEVYFPTRGWMCVDATDPLQGNWLRYVNWARSTQEQNLFPLEINRAIYYKVLRPIGPGEELLVWYNGEDNPEIAAALEEERASSLSKKNSPRARRARKKLLERQAAGRRPALKPTATHSPTPPDMRELEQGLNEDESPSLSSGLMKETPLGTMATVHPSQHPPGRAEDSEHPPSETPPTSEHPPSEAPPPSELHPSEAPPPSEEPPPQQEEEEEEEEPEEDEEEQPPSMQSPERPAGGSTSPDPQGPCTAGRETPESPEVTSEGLSSARNAEQELAEPEPEGDLEDDLQGESHPCQHCERRFSTKQGLERHAHIHSLGGQQEALSFCCRYCGKSFGSQVGRPTPRASPREHRPQTTRLAGRNRHSAQPGRRLRPPHRHGDAERRRCRPPSTTRREQLARAATSGGS
ncbi:hypothetical protein AALO_G00146000 [Alosa alosa]|uniref:PR domain zinc finger protein 2 n=1 Tax=Alosa alosa TaxID=278164 RepID=A0AAV6GJB3_9TELE|nr:hypothetical protein AALO_G00146000 [Alosa alosa]